jgi:hypothetical protein
MLGLVIQPGAPLMAIDGDDDFFSDDDTWIEDYIMPIAPRYIPGKFVDMRGGPPPGFETPFSVFDADGHCCDGGDDYAIQSANLETGVCVVLLKKNGNYYLTNNHELAAAEKLFQPPLRIIDAKGNEL